LEIRSGGGDLRLADVTGPVSAATSGGVVEASNVARALNLRTGGGGIKVMGEAGTVTAETAGGDIQVASAREAQLRTAGGSIQVARCSQVRAFTGGGNIEIGNVQGVAVLETNGGSIRVGAALGRVDASTSAGLIELFNLNDGVHAQTGSGAITAEFLGAGMSDSHLESSLGDVTVFLAPSVKFRVQATVQTASGRAIRSEFPELTVQSEGAAALAPGNLYAEGALNGGGPMLKVSTISGNIDFRYAAGR
jgi:DUF4097 and DUF4098 domain-containing protein YvlB